MNMEVDELRKRIFELDSLLGKAMGTAEKVMEHNADLMRQNEKLAEALIKFSLAVRSYVHTMKKDDLIKAIDDSHAFIQNLRPVKV